MKLSNQADSPRASLCMQRFEWQAVMGIATVVTPDNWIVSGSRYQSDFAQEFTV